jgi:hypothetical protein
MYVEEFIRATMQNPFQMYEYCLLIHHKDTHFCVQFSPMMEVSDLLSYVRPTGRLLVPILIALEAKKCQQGHHWLVAGLSCYFVNSISVYKFSKH